MADHVKSAKNNERVEFLVVFKYFFSYLPDLVNSHIDRLHDLGELIDGVEYPHPILLLWSD